MTRSELLITSPGPATVAAAERLLRAQDTGRACAPIRELIGPDNLVGAYAVQRRITAARTAGGARVVGRKVGLTSAAVQQQLGVTQPDLGMLFADMEYSDGDSVPIGRFLQPRVEAEVAFVLAEDLDEDDLGLGRVRRAVDHAVAALEICDSRIAGWDISLADTVADNASAGAYVLSSERRSLSDFEPRAATMTMGVTDQEVSTGAGVDCLGDPLAAVAWLARQARDFGDPLRAGQVVLSGALGPMRPVRAGSVVRADIEGLGTVSVRFEEGQ